MDYDSAFEDWQWPLTVAARPETLRGVLSRAKNPRRDETKQPTSGNTFRGGVFARRKF